MMVVRGGGPAHQADQNAMGSGHIVNRPGADNHARSAGMALQVEAFDWSATPLGPRFDWPACLNTALQMVLASPFPAVLAWGPTLITIYNDAYRPLLGDKPEALGRPLLDVWSEVRDVLAPLTERALAGESCCFETSAFAVLSAAEPAQTVFDFSLSPVRSEDGAVAGLLNIAVDATTRLDAQALAHSEQRLRALVEASSNSLYRMSADWSEMHQLEGGGFLADTTVSNPNWLEEYIHPDDQNRVREAIQNAIRHKATFDLEHRVRLADGALGWTHSRAVPVLAADGEIVEWFGAATDMTERRRAEERLRDSEARLSRVLEHLPMGVGLIDREGRYTLKNPQLNAFVGDVIPSRDETSAVTWEGFDAAGRPLAREDYPGVRALRGEDVTAALYFRRVVDNEPERWIQVSAVPLRESSGEVSGAVTVLQDATDELRIQRELQASEARARKLNETLEAQVAERSAERDRLWNLSQDMLARADYVGMMSAVSPAWTQVLGWSETDLLSRGYASFMHPDDISPTLRAIGRMAETRQPTRFENRFATADGGWRSIEWTVAPEADGLNFIAVGRDVTLARTRENELSLAQEQLRQSQKMEAMGQLTGGVAHDFNNLLMPIIGSLDVLVRREVGDERERRLIDGALQAAERAKTLVQRLLAFARRQPLQATSVDLRDLIQNMAGLVDSTSGPDVQVHALLAENLPPAKADPNQLEMAILNLAVNARDAMPAGGVLTLSASREAILPDSRANLPPGDYIRLSIADTGAGMDEATRARAVEPFFSTKGVGKGTGLGLSMVHGLASQLGGELTIDSAPGEGTTVSLWLPVSQDRPNLEVAVDSHGPRRAAAGRALLVDDEDLVRMATADMLMDLGYEVIEAASGPEALHLIENGLAPDLVVTDHLMPGMSGADLARQVQSRSPEVPVLIISGYAEAEGLPADLARLTKPFRNAELAAKLADLGVLAEA
jgi:PAS domain S-box-containing protein